MTTIISAPGDLIIATSDGIDVRFAGVAPTFLLPPGVGEVPGSGGVVVYFEGVPSLETRHRDQRHLKEIDQWAERRKLHGTEAAGRFPIMPGEPVLERVKVRISDDVGTEYRWVGGKVAGTGTEWDGCWGYAPEPPMSARLLNFEFTLDGEPTGKRCQVQLN
ncbi:hypothetical protein [Arthrobacter livingstonensis]|uniref:hypothetical protein n=1 Tax=Arthrobacter livingstonensis TaxID=670078 RepID=UPI0011B85A1C|nr:hypothetical protein [Arthrobacter livingstonensis]